ncbi:reverse transcriptase domain-containing protein, partial [Tanacetum coccineum]
MRTRNSNFPNNSPVTIPRRRNRRRAPNVVEPELRTIVEVAPMAERTMEELLRGPTERYGEAIVIPEINADHFEIKTNLLQLVQASPFHGFERENPHTHINNFKRITSTLKFRDVPNDVIKLMMFPYSLEGAARVWILGEMAWKLAQMRRRSSLSVETRIVSTEVRHTPATVVEQETEEKTDKEQTNFQGSTAHVPPPVNPIPIPKPDFPKTLPNLNIPYPSILNDQKFREKASKSIGEIFQICASTLASCFHFPNDFVVVDFEADPRVPLILGRSFLRTGRALIDVYEGELILRNRDERLIFHVDKHPQKHANESIKMINFIDFSCEDSFGEVLRLKKSNHFSSGNTTPFFDSRPSLVSFETSDSLLEEFADELALLNPFPPGNEDADVEAELREIELLLNRDPSTNFSPKITFDPNPERFIDEPALVCLPPPGDDKSFLNKDVQKENFKIYSNPLFEFNDEYISSDVNPLFDEAIEDI